jgi:mannose-6-phosphate isomerase-like protein (cupin superfamily)
MTTPYWFFETHLRVLHDAQQSGCGYDLVEGRFPPGVETPPHLHTRYDELLYVLEGAFSVYTSTGTVTLAAGEHLFVPCHTPHVVAGTGTNRALTIAAPGGLAAMVRAIGIPDETEGISPGHSNDMATFLRLTQEAGDLILGVPGARPVRVPRETPRP